MECGDGPGFGTGRASDVNEHVRVLEKVSGF